MIGIGGKIAATGVIIGLFYVVLDIRSGGKVPRWVERFVLSTAVAVTLLGALLAVWSA